MANEFIIKNGFVSKGDSIILGDLSGQTFNIINTPVNNNSATEILVRNSTTGNVEYRNSSTLSGGSSTTNVFVNSGNADVATQQLTFTNTTGGTFNVTNSTSLFSDNDINVTGGTYDANTGCVTFGTNSGTTFDICGFVTGLTDTFTTGGTYNNTTGEITFTKTDNSTYDVDISSISGGTVYWVEENSGLKSNRSGVTGSINGTSIGSLIAGGNSTNEIFSGGNSTILNGGNNIISGSTVSALLSTQNSSINSNPSAIGDISHAVIVGGLSNTIEDTTLQPSERATLLGGSTNIIDGGLDSSIIGGSNNTITQIGSGIYTSRESVISGGSRSAIVGGTGNILDANRSVILGGQNIVGTTDNTVYVPNLNIGNVGSGTPLINLGLDSSGNVVTGTTSGGGGSSSTITGYSYNSDSNTFTIGLSGGTSFGSQILEVSGLTVTNDLIVSGSTGIGTDTPTEKLHIKSTTDAKIKIEADINDVDDTDTADILLSQDGGISTSNIGISPDSINDLVIGVNSTTNPSIKFATRNDGTTFSTTADTKMTLSNNGNLGIGTINPTQKLHVDSGDILIQNDAIFDSNLNTNIPYVRISGDTNDLAQILATTEGSLGVGIGSRGSAEAGFPGYGKVKDGFLYSSNAQNGLNIISSPGTGTEDYIRFFAGDDADGTTANMFIAGTGSTKGYVGINTETPTAQLFIQGDSSTSTGPTDTNNFSLLIQNSLNENILLVKNGNNGVAGSNSGRVCVNGNFSGPLVGDDSVFSVYGDTSSSPSALGLVMSLSDGQTNTLHSFYNNGAASLAYGGIQYSKIGVGTTTAASINAKLHVKVGDEWKGTHNNDYTLRVDGLENVAPYTATSNNILTLDNFGNLNVKKRTTTENFTMTSGATDGYVLTSDASGNSRWAPASGATTGYWVEGGSSNDSIFDTKGGQTISGSAINSIIAGGETNLITEHDYSGIFAGSENKITGSTLFNETNNVIIGGNSNIIGTTLGYAEHNSILGGTDNTIDGRARRTTLIGGTGNSILNSVDDSSIIGGNNNEVKSSRSVVLGGANMTATTTSDTVYVPKLNVRDIGNGTPLINLGLDSDGFVVTGTTGSGTSFSWSDPVVTSGNNNSDCISDLYVSNLHSCSPLHINPDDEGNVYFGSLSGLTVELSSDVNIGVGTNSPLSKLHVNNGNILVSNENGSLTLSSTTTGGGGNYGNNLYFRSAGSIDYDGAIKSVSNGSSGSLQFLTTPTTGILTEHMVLTSRGRLGIGAAVPDASIHISGNTLQQISIDSRSNNSVLKLKSSDSKDSYIQFEEASGTRWLVGSYNGNDQFVWTTGSTLGTDAKMGLTTAGNLGIGNIRPETRLHVNKNNLPTTPTLSADNVALFESDNITDIAIIGDSSRSVSISLGDENDLKGSITYENATDQLTLKADNTTLLTLDSSTIINYKPLELREFGTGTPTFNLQVRETGSGGYVVVTGATGGDSGNCITDLWVTNLESCSPLNINTQNQGNVYVGNDGGLPKVTLDITTPNESSITFDEESFMKYKKSQKELIIGEPEGGGKVKIEVEGVDTFEVSKTTTKINQGDLEAESGNIIIKSGNSKTLVIEDIPDVSGANLGTDVDGKLIDLPSDSRVKVNIQEIDEVVNPLEFMKSIKGYQFEYDPRTRISKPGTKHYGFKVDDFREGLKTTLDEKINPDEQIINDIGKTLVKTCKTKYNIGKDKLESVDAMNYVDLIPFMVESIKKLDTNIDNINTDGGNDGVGITTTIDNEDGTFTFNYSNGTSFTTSNLKGESGENGADGLQGIQGAKGADGKNGNDGLQGIQGKQGAKGDKGDPGTNGSGTDTYVISGQYNSRDRDIILTLNNGDVVSIPFTPTDNNNFITSGRIDGDDLILTDNNGVDSATIDISNLGGDDKYLDSTSLPLDSNHPNVNQLTLEMNDGTQHSVDMSGFRNDSNTAHRKLGVNDATNQSPIIVTGTRQTITVRHDLGEFYPLFIIYEVTRGEVVLPFGVGVPNSTGAIPANNVTGPHTLDTIDITFESAGTYIVKFVG